MAISPLLGSLSNATEVADSLHRGALLTGVSAPVTPALPVHTFLDKHDFSQDQAVSNNTRRLFTSHSLEELARISRKLKADAAKKNHLLSELLSERYKDVLEACRELEVLASTGAKLCTDLDNLIEVFDYDPEKTIYGIDITSDENIADQSKNVEVSDNVMKTNISRHNEPKTDLRGHLSKPASSFDEDDCKKPAVPQKNITNHDDLPRDIISKAWSFQCKGDYARAMDYWQHPELEKTRISDTLERYRPYLAKDYVNDLAIVTEDGTPAVTLGMSKVAKFLGSDLAAEFLVAERRAILESCDPRRIITAAKLHHSLVDVDVKCDKEKATLSFESWTTGLLKELKEVYLRDPHRKLPGGHVDENFTVYNKQSSPLNLSPETTSSASALASKVVSEWIYNLRIQRDHQVVDAMLANAAAAVEEAACISLVGEKSKISLSYLPEQQIIDIAAVYTSEIKPRFIEEQTRRASNIDQWNGDINSKIKTLSPPTETTLRAYFETRFEKMLETLMAGPARSAPARLLRAVHALCVSMGEEASTRVYIQRAAQIYVESRVSVCVKPYAARTLPLLAGIGPQLSAVLRGYLADGVLLLENTKPSGQTCNDNAANTCQLLALETVFPLTVDYIQKLLFEQIRTKTRSQETATAAMDEAAIGKENSSHGNNISNEDDDDASKTDLPSTKKEEKRHQKEQPQHEQNEIQTPTTPPISILRAYSAAYYVALVCLSSSHLSSFVETLNGMIASVCKCNGDDSHFTGARTEAEAAYARTYALLSPLPPKTDILASAESNTVLAISARLLRTRLPKAVVTSSACDNSADEFGESGGNRRSNENTKSKYTATSGSGVPTSPALPPNEKSINAKDTAEDNSHLAKIGAEKNRNWFAESTTTSSGSTSGGSNIYDTALGSKYGKKIDIVGGFSSNPVGQAENEEFLDMFWNRS